MTAGRVRVKTVRCMGVIMTSAVSALIVAADVELENGTGVVDGMNTEGASRREPLGSRPTRWVEITTEEVEFWNRGTLVDVRVR